MAELEFMRSQAFSAVVIDYKREKLLPYGQYDRWFALLNTISRISLFHVNCNSSVPKNILHNVIQFL